jgi:hypothetical protein
LASALSQPEIIAAIEATITTARSSAMIFFINVSSLKLWFVPVESGNYKVSIHQL